MEPAARYELIDEVVFRPQRAVLRWGKPASASLLCHATAVAMLSCLGSRTAAPPLAPGRGLEIHFMDRPEIPRSPVQRGRVPSLSHRRSTSPSSPMSAQALPARPSGKIAAPAPAAPRPTIQELPSQPVAAPPRPVAKLAARSPLFGDSQEVDTARLAGTAYGKLYFREAELTASLPVPSGAPEPQPSTPAASKNPLGGGPAGLTAPVPAVSQGDMGGTAAVPRLERQGLAVIAEYPLQVGASPKADPPASAMPPASGDLFAIDGALSRRRIIKMTPPRYPRWAEERGIEAQVSVWLAATVRGEVVPDFFVLRTSGYPELDRIVLDAVRSIVFAPDPESEAGREDSGVVTFNFKLRRSARGWP